MYQSGEIVLLEYPYTDLVGTKLRPAVVLKDTGDNDFIVIRATSQPKLTEYDITIEDWQFCGLLKPSIMRVHKMATLETNLVKKKMGVLSKNDLNKLYACLQGLFNLKA
jgi:mRNA interferase MazF